MDAVFFASAAACDAQRGLRRGAAARHFDTLAEAPIGRERRQRSPEFCLDGGTARMVCSRTQVLRTRPPRRPLTHPLVMSHLYRTGRTSVRRTRR